MKNLTTKIEKNVVVTDLNCTPNSIVLAKQTISTRNDEVQTSVKYVEVCQVEKTDPLTLIKTLLKYCVGEFLVCKDLENDFAETKVKQRKLFAQFLRTNKIYRTNAEGKITSALESEVPFSQTALNVKDYHTIATCKKENLKAAIHQHAKAVQAQCNYYSLIENRVAQLDKDLEAAAPKPKLTPKGKKPAVAV